MLSFSGAWLVGNQLMDEALCWPCAQPCPFNAVLGMDIDKCLAVTCGHNGGVEKLLLGSNAGPGLSLQAP